MAKWSGKVGFVTEHDDGTGIFTTEPIERPYVGDLFRNNRRLKNGPSVNDAITISNQISIVADPFLKNNFHSIRYATYMGVKWKVESVDVQFPRLNLELGGEYING